jgi:hypothetical protein
MMISPLHNDVLKKKEFWILFSKNYNCDFKHIQTPSKDVNKLKIEYSINNIRIFFLETDAKPFICEFEVATDKKRNIEICQLSLFDKLFSLFQKKDNNTNLFLKANKVRSNDEQFVNILLKDDDLLNRLNNSEFFNLYGYTERSFLKVRITCTYFVNNYDKLVEIYSIIRKLIGYFSKIKDR